MRAPFPRWLLAALACVAVAPHRARGELPTVLGDGNCVAVSAWSELSADLGPSFERNGVIKVTTQNFDALTGSGTPFLLNLYVPTCPHCKALMPHVESVAAQVAAAGAPHGLRVGWVNCADESALCRARLNIKSIPELWFFAGDGASPQLGCADVASSLSQSRSTPQDIYSCRPPSRGAERWCPRSRRRDRAPLTHANAGAVAMAFFCSRRSYYHREKHADLIAAWAIESAQARTVCCRFLSRLSHWRWCPIRSDVTQTMRVCACALGAAERVGARRRGRAAHGRRRLRLAVLSQR
jgi:thiol-disulfide isomerase/thioredoxin